jgi:regulator of sirC expression with transglutaminase-like and TPR domain
LRDDSGDAERALADLGHATGLAKAPPESFRALGLLQKQRQQPAAAAEAFRTYLAKAPQAADAELVRSYLAELQ